MTYKPDLEQARTMLKALAPHDGAFFTFATIKGKATQHFYGSLEQYANQLTQLNQQGAGVYVTVNQTNGQGRKAENITAVRALFVDFDTVEPDRVENLLSLDLFYEGMLEPSLIVESSTGKHHAYWILDKPNDTQTTLKNFSQWQKQLINFFDSLGDSPDKAINDLSRVMRLAGFYHTKSEPVLTKVIHLGKRYTVEQLAAMVGSLPAIEPASQNRTENKTDSKGSIADCEDFTKDAPIGLSVAEIKHYLGFIADNTSYQTWLEIGMILHHEFSGGLDGLELWNDWAATAPNYSGYDELAEKWQTFDSKPKDKPATARTLIHLAKQNPSYKDYQLTSDDIDSAKAIIDELAKLDELNYQMQKRAKAKILGLSVTDIDKIVKQARQELEVNEVVSIVADIEPHPEPVNGDLLAGEICALINNHIACDDAIAVTVTLWLFFTWCIDASYIAPIAWINAPEKRCGKTQLATLMGRMSKKAITTTNITPAALFRCIDRFNPTLVIDEADTFMKENEDLRAIVNAGFSRDNPYIWRSVGDNHEPTPFNVFGAKVISGIGKLPATIVDRSISLTLRRAMKHEKKQRLRDLSKDTTDTIRAKLTRWTDDNLATVSAAKPQLPESIYNREFDTWEILFQIADTIGGDWLERIKDACLNITGNEPAEPSINEQLLADIKAIFEKRQTDRLATTDLINCLTSDFGDDEVMRWATHNNGKPMTDRQLAKRLKDFKINNKTLRIGGEVKKGYDLNDFKDAFSRYLS